MAEAEVDRPSVPPDPTPGRGRLPWVRGMACVAMIPLLGFIGQTGQTLWGEWNSLRRDQVDERESAIVGYLNITPNPSYASKPPDWFHDEGDVSLLWAGWKEGEHRWFRFGRGDLEGLPLTEPIGRDAIQAIDDPVYEREGGARWGRIPHEAQVVGFGEGGQAVAYPIKVLNKVEVVNDRVGDRSILIVLAPDSEKVAIYEPTLEGHRVTLGHSGYFARTSPILYDRGSHSLWSEGEGRLVAIAGPRKGASLKLISRPTLVAWGDWRTENPDGRLLVGADRSKAVPAD